MEDATRYPIDFDLLEKGSYIPPETLEHTFQVNRNMTAYSLKIMALCTEIMRQLSDRGLEVVAKQHKAGIKILDDAEASAHTYQEAQNAMLKYRRNLTRALAVDRSLLDEGTQSIHDSRLLVMSRVYHAASNAKREARKMLSSPPPDVPSLIGSDKH